MTMHNSRPELSIDLSATVEKITDELGDASLALTRLAKEVDREKGHRYWKLIFIAENLERACEILIAAHRHTCGSCRDRISNEIMEMAEPGAGISS